MEPLTTLATAAKVTLVPAVKGFVAKLPHRNDEAFQKVRQEVFEDWTIEVDARSQERYVHSLRICSGLQDQINELHGRMEERSADPACARVDANYARAADTEAIDERRRMLAFADAALIDTSMSIAEHARAERLIRELDPDDVLWLHVIDQAAGNFFEGTLLGSPGRVRWSMWERAGADILVAAGCVRINHRTRGPGAGDTPFPPAFDEVDVTREGKLVLRVLRAYVCARPLPMRVPGREARPGDRTEAEAQAIVDALPGLRAAVMRLGTRRAPRYDFPVLHYQTGTPPPHDAKGIQRFEGLTQDEAVGLETVAPAPPGPIPQIRQPVSGLSASAQNMNNGTWSANVSGPHDVLRWLAEDANAFWLA